MRSTLFQIVDGSTYNNSTSMSKSPSVIMKLIFMAVRVFRTFVNLPLPDKSEVKATYYTAFSFNKTVGAMKYVLAGYGWHRCGIIIGRSIYYLEQCRSHNSINLDIIIINNSRNCNNHIKILMSFFISNQIMDNQESYITLIQIDILISIIFSFCFDIMGL